MLAQWVEELDGHAFGGDADIVVALDRHARAAGEGHAFDHVGVEGALCQEVGAAELLRFFLEHIDEFAADELALLLGVGDAGEACHEARSEEHTSELQSLMRTSYAVFCLKKKKKNKLHK